MPLRSGPHDKPNEIPLPYDQMQEGRFKVLHHQTRPDTILLYYQSNAHITAHGSLANPVLTTSLPDREGELDTVPVLTTSLPEPLWQRVHAVPVRR